tara:strand:+ start:898 stop:2028 length:1131 start_codon:yes stop_codon:yes gene_type:complete
VLVINNYLKNYKIMKYSNFIGPIIIIGIIFLVALSVSRNYLVVNFNGALTNNLSTYENFYLNNFEKQLDIRDCGNSIDLSDRHKLRWVLWEAKTQIYILSKELFGFAGAGAAFALIHALIITLTFWFTQQNIIYCMNSISNEKRGVAININNSEIFIVNAIVFLTLFLYTFNGQVSEFNYSVTEALFISVAFYSALKKRIFLFVIIVSLAVLNRESGFVLLSLWVLFNGLYLKNFYKNFYLLLPPVVFIIANFSMLQCLFQDNFLMSRAQLPGQVTYHIFFNGLWGFIRGILAVFFNYIIYFGPAYIAYKWLSKFESNDSTIFKKIISVLGVYILVFLVATPLNHMSVKFLMVPFICVLLSIYIIGKIENWEDNKK